MNKRSNEHSQLQSFEFEALNEQESEDVGIFKRASDEEMSKRKIVKTLRRPSTSNDQNSLTDSKPSNPFAGFSGFSASKPPENTQSKPTFSFTSSNASAPSSKGQGLNSIKPDSSETEYLRKVKKLNQSFENWAERQIKENAISVWKEGVKDYIKYRNQLNTKFPDDHSKLIGSIDNENSSNNTKVEISSVPSLPLSNSQSTSSNIPPSNGFTFNSAPFIFGAKTSEPETKPPVPSFTFGSKAPEPEAKPSIPSFSFGSKAPEPEAKPSIPSFSFGSKAPEPETKPSIPSFSFGSKAPEPETKPSIPSFSFGSNSSSGFQFNSSGPSTTTANADNEAGGEEDYEGEPMLEPEKILKNENDKDEIIIEVSCKLFNFNSEDKEWKDTGKGTFRITEDPDTKKKRMLVRNAMGKITFNANFFKNMKFEKMKNSLKFSAFVLTETKKDSKTEYKSFMLKLKDSEVDLVLNKLQEIVSQIA